MKSKLAQLEQYLKNLVEKSANVLWKNERLDLVQKLIAAMEQEAGTNAKSTLNVPNALVIQLHPKDFATWQENKDLTNSIATALHEAAVELDLPISGRPTVYLEPSPEIPENQLAVSLVLQEETKTKTAILSAENAKDDHQDRANQKAFLILENGSHFRLGSSVINIGRRTSNELVIDDPHISREHAQIRMMKGCHVLLDLNSRGGTFVNGRKINQHSLQPGDVISLSGHPIIYLLEGNELPGGETESGITDTTRISPSSDEMEEKE